MDTKTRFCRFFTMLLSTSLTIPAALLTNATASAAQSEVSAPPQIRQALSAMRQEIQTKRLNYTVGYTKAMMKPRANLLGDQDDPRITKAQRIQQNQKAQQTLRLDVEARNRFLKANPAMAGKLPDITIQAVCNANLGAFDWRNRGKVSPVREQECGNCWAFAAVGAYEGSYLMRNGSSSDAAEQYINDCATADGGADAGSCSGGLADKALQHMVREGNAHESVVPYTGTNKVCSNPATPLDAIAWGYVEPSTDFPTRSQIKAALCEYGPLATRMRVVSGNLFAYTGGVYNETVASDTSGGGHAVVIVGWDDSKNAWLIKNSWGTDWGMNGFGWIGYNSNRIGRHTAWIKAASKFYALAPGMMQLAPKKPAIQPRPLPRPLVAPRPLKSQ